MLINQKRWLKEHTGQQVKQALTEKSDYMIVDQDSCSILLKGKIKKLGVVYNFSSVFYGYDIKEFLRANKLNT